MNCLLVGAEMVVWMEAPHETEACSWPKVHVPCYARRSTRIGQIGRDHVFLFCAVTFQDGFSTSFISFNRVAASKIIL